MKHSHQDSKRRARTRASGQSAHTKHQHRQASEHRRQTCVRVCALTSGGMDHGGAPSGAETARAPSDGGVAIHRSSKGPTLATTTGAVVVISGKNTGQQQQQYQSPATTAATTSKDHAAAGGKPAFFLAVLAPNADAALQFLANRPPGAHLLVKDEDDNLALYIKFRQAVRAIVVVKAKELKKHDDAIVWGRPYRAPPDGAASSGAASQLSQTHSTMLTPVHRLYLPPELHTSLEQCWKRFLPQVKAILLQMCCEPSLDEDIKLDDWSAVVSSAQTPCIIALTAQSCGFYFIGTNSGAAASSASSSSSTGTSSSSSAVPVRHVELDFQKHVIVVADGTFNPSAFIVSTHFSSKKIFDADLTYVLVRLVVSILLLLPLLFSTDRSVALVRLLSSCHSTNQVQDPA